MDNKKLEHLEDNYKVQILEHINSLNKTGNKAHAEKVQMFYEEFPLASKFMCDNNLVCS